MVLYTVSSMNRSHSNVSKRQLDSDTVSRIQLSFKLPWICLIRLKSRDECLLRNLMRKVVEPLPFLPLSPPLESIMTKGRGILFWHTSEYVGARSARLIRSESGATDAPHRYYLSLRSRHY